MRSMNTLTDNEVRELVRAGEKRGYYKGLIIGIIACSIVFIIYNHMLWLGL